MIFADSCLGPTALFNWNNVHWNLRYAITDFGMIALALLANDRYQTIKYPVQNFVGESNKVPSRRALGFAILVVLTNCFDTFVQSNLILGKIHLAVFAGILFPLFQAIRAVYLLVCFYM